MEIVGLHSVCYHGRHYIRTDRFDPCFETLGERILKKITADPKTYPEWLALSRDNYESLEKEFEEHVHTIRDGEEPDYTRLRRYAVPSLFPRIDSSAEYIYTINLDTEVVTTNHAVHWQLHNLPRKSETWLRAMSETNYTIDTLDFDPSEHLTSLDLPLPDEDWTFGTNNVRMCTAFTELSKTSPHEAWNALVATEILTMYSPHIMRSGRQWPPDAPPFRELAFAIVSAAAGKVKFHSLSTSSCNPFACLHSFCNGPHLKRSPGWLDKEWVGSEAPLLQFGSLAHKPDVLPGTAPAETTYWLQPGILISLTLVVDGVAITKAMRWGVKRMRKKRWRAIHFYMVILSLFDVALAEVTWLAEAKQPCLRTTKAQPLSPFREHLPSQPAKKRNGQSNFWELPDNNIIHTSYKRSVDQLQEEFPGIAAMASFFSTVAWRQAAVPSTVRQLPMELCSQILDLVDYDTWKACLSLSPPMRALCLAKYRLDDHTAIVRGPSILLDTPRQEYLMAFDFEDLQTRKKISAMRTRTYGKVYNYNWMPILGSGDRKALITDVSIHFKPHSGPESPVRNEYSLGKVLVETFPP